MPQPVELTLEQQFSIRFFETQVQDMTREQAQEFLVKLHKQMMMQENTYKTYSNTSGGLLTRLTRILKKGGIPT